MYIKENPILTTGAFNIRDGSMLADVALCGNFAQRETSNVN